jgi:DNA-binding transcriptional regulator YdaS (Cro superfamily)
LKTYIAKESHDAVRKLLCLVGTNYAYLIQIASGFRKPRGRQKLLLEHPSNGKLTRHELRPDLYPEA